MNVLKRLAVFGLAVGGLALGGQSADAQWRARFRWQEPIYTPVYVPPARVEVRPVAPPAQVQVTTPAPVIQTQTQTRIDQTLQPTGTINLPRASAILNARVSLSGGNFSGRIVDLILDDFGCVKHVIIRHDNHFVMLPYSLIRFDAAQSVVHVNMAADRFRQAPTFTQWSMVTDPRFTQQVDTFFGVNARGNVGVNQPGPGGVEVQVPAVQQQQRQPQQPQQFQQPQTTNPPLNNQNQQNRQPQTTAPNDPNRPQQQAIPPSNPTGQQNPPQTNTPPIPNGQSNERPPDE